MLRGRVFTWAGSFWPVGVIFSIIMKIDQLQDTWTLSLLPSWQHIHRYTLTSWFTASLELVSSRMSWLRDASCCLFYWLSLLSCWLDLKVYKDQISKYKVFKIILTYCTFCSTTTYLETHQLLSDSPTGQMFEQLYGYFANSPLSPGQGVHGCSCLIPFPTLSSVLPLVLSVMIKCTQWL